MTCSEEVNKKSKVLAIYIYIYILVIWKKIGYNLFLIFILNTYESGVLTFD